MFPKQRVIYLVEEPRAEVYANLIRYAATKCDRFYLVWREQSTFNESAQRLAGALRRWEINRVRTDAWDGTRLLGAYAVVYHYRLDQPAADILIAAASGLYDWLEPDLPEDLTFLAKGGTCWMGTVSHEKVGWLPAHQVTRGEIRSNVPNLNLTYGEGLLLL